MKKKLFTEAALIGLLLFCTKIGYSQEVNVKGVDWEPIPEVVETVDLEYENEMYLRTQSKLEMLKEEQEAIKTEMYYGEMELIAQLVRAEAGNQSLEGKRAVADVVLNRVDSSKFPDTIPEVIFQDRQFSCVVDGNFDKAAWTVDETDFEAVEMEMENRTDSAILYFSSGDCCNGTYAYTIGDHYFAK